MQLGCHGTRREAGCTGLWTFLTAAPGRAVPCCGLIQRSLLKAFLKPVDPVHFPAPAISKPRIAFPLVIHYHRGPSRWKSFRVALKLKFLYLETPCLSLLIRLAVRSSGLEMCPSKVAFITKLSSSNCVYLVGGTGESPMLTSVQC